MPKLTDDNQRAIIGARLSKALSTSDAELRKDREKALDFYYGRPMGNEIEGRSQVVSKDMMDTIEWIMPSLMRVFCTMNAVAFDPVGPEDEDLAKQETQYVRHVLWKKNPGFMNLYNWLKDGLMQKVGYVKYWWEEEDEVKFDTYSGLTDDQLVLTLQDLSQDGEVEIVGKEQDANGTWSIKLKTKSKYGCFEFDCVPGDEVIVAASCRADIKKANFVGHLRRNVTRSELIEEGYDRDLVKTLTSYSWDNNALERLARDTVNESVGDDEENVDEATQEIQLLECWTYLDADDDGVAELRHYLMAGDETLENEEAEEIPWESWTPIPVPHRHAGLSIYDIMEDLQRIKTALQRGLLDNVYFTNSPRLIYDKNTIDVGTLQINRPGGHVANDGPPIGAAVPVPVNPMAGNLLPVIDYFDNVRETRTGVGRMSVGVDADVLAQSTKGAYMDAKGAANQRIEAIARIFAETGYTSLFSSTHKTLMHHQNHAEQLKLNDKWITVNPTEWRERANLTVSVGLGNASKDEIRQNLLLMAQAQQQAAQVQGLIQPKNVFALFRRMQVELGFENDAFITDPSSPEFQQAQQGQSEDPIVTAEKVKQGGQLQAKQIDQQTEAANLALKNKELDQERALEITKLEVESHVDLAKAGIGAEVAVARANGAKSGNGAAAPRQSAPSGSA